MNFMTADVEIKVDDSRLPAQLSKARNAVTKTATKIKASFKKMGASFKVVFDKMVRVAKWGALAITGAFVLVVRAAMKQEDVINRLNITLRATGHAAGFTSKQLLLQAAALQKVTRFGDESITALQTMLLTFKQIKGDEFKRATEAALDMAVAEAAVSGRTVDLTATSIRLGKALNDPILGITALSRVGVQFSEEQKELIKTLAETGKMAEAQAVILKELEAQFGGMARDADTASGSLKQMWNALGDVAEIIGDAFLPGIKDTTQAIKEWAERNQESIGRWAEVTAAYLAYAKDVLWAFIKFLKSDWRIGIKLGLNASLEVFKGFGKSLMIIMEDIFTRLYNNMSVWLKRAVARKAVFKELKRMYQKELGKELAALSPLPRAEYMTLWKSIPESAGLKAEGVMAEPDAMSAIEEEFPTIERGVARVGEKLKRVWKDVGASIKDIMPPEVGTAFEQPLKKLRKRLEEIKVVAEEIEVPLEKALISVPEKATEAMDETNKVIQEMMNALDFEYNLIGKSNEARFRAVELARMQVEVSKLLQMGGETELEFLNRKSEIMDEYTEKLERNLARAREMNEEVDKTLTGWAAVGESLGVWMKNAGNWGKNLGQIMTNTFDSMAESLANALMGMKMDWKAFARMFIQQLLVMIIKLQIAFALQTAMGFWGGFGGGGQAVGLTAAGAQPGYAGMQGKPPGMQHGGEVLKSGWAKVDKGEVFSGVNNEMGFGNTIVNISDYAGVDIEVNEYKDSDQRIIDVSLAAAAGDGNYRRSHKIS